MKKLLTLLFLIPYISFGATILYPQSGGRGTSTIPTMGQINFGDSIGNFSQNTLTAGSNITITNATNSITIATTGISPFPFTPSSSGNSTSTTIIFNNGLISTASSTFSNNLNVSGRLTASSTINAGRGIEIQNSSALTSSDGIIHLGGGNVGDSLLFDSGFSNWIVRSYDSLGGTAYVNDGGIGFYFQATIGGSPTIYVSGIATSTLTGDGTFSNFGGGFISSASSTVANNLQIAGGLQASSTLTVGSLATLYNGFLSAASSTINGTLVVTGTLTNDNLSTGLIYSNAGAFTLATVNSPLGFSGGVLSCSTCSTFAYPFNGTSLGNSTTSLMQFNGGFISSASSTIASNFQVSGLTTLTNATTTFVDVSRNLIIGYNSGNSGLFFTGSGGGVNQTLWNDNLNVITLMNQNNSAMVFGTNGNERLRLLAGGVLNIENGFNSSASSSIAAPITITAPLTASSTFDVKDATVIQHIYPSLTFSTSTISTTTMTVQLGDAHQRETWVDAECKADNLVMAIQFQNGTNLLDYILASSSYSRTTFTKNNIFTNGTARSFVASSSVANQISCSLNIIRNF